MGQQIIDAFQVNGLEHRGQRLLRGALRKAPGMGFDPKTHRGLFPLRSRQSQTGHHSDT